MDTEAGVSKPIMLTADEAMSCIASWREVITEYDEDGLAHERFSGRVMTHIQSGFGCDMSLEAVEQWVREPGAEIWIISAGLSRATKHALAVRSPDGKARAIQSNMQRIRELETVRA